MPVLKSLIPAISQAVALTPEQVKGAVSALVEESIPTEEKAEFLVALSKKGETPEEIASFAEELRNLSIQPALDAETRAGEILDVCGTGGDRLHTFNISTTVAIVAASAGVKMAKHGNRAITSKAGSADVLEELGIPTQLNPTQAAQALKEVNFAFFFAPAYHPAFKNIGPCRKLCADQGHRTIFNFLGPLLNPVRPTAQLLGVPRPELTQPLARVLKQLGSRRVMVVSGHTPEGYLDELSTFSKNTIAEFYQERGFHHSTLDPFDFAFPPATLADLRGGDRKENAEIIRNILGGKDTSPRLDAVLLNSGAALFVGGKVSSLTQGIELTRELIGTGKALAKLSELVQYRPA